MTDEFDLSKKIWYDGAMYLINSEDVNEFIRRETLLITELDAGLITFEEFWRRRNLLAGEKLK